MTTEYRVRIPDPNNHCFEISLAFRGNGQAVVLSLPAWIPGSYMIRDFARHVLELSASTDGQTLDAERLDKQTWRLPPVSGDIRVDYRVYAFDLSVRGAHVDDSHAYFNGTSLFLRLRGREHQPHEVIIEPVGSDGRKPWIVATTLPALDTDDRGFGRYHAADYEGLIDHPVEIADLECGGFEVDGVFHELAFHGRQDADIGRICKDLAKICAVHGELFGLPLPFARYLFLVSVTADGYGGLEHRDSTSLMCARSDLPRLGEEKVSEGYRRFLGLCSHEYFHAWNIKRIRPARLAEADLTGEAYTELLWAFEGITSYYDDLALVRAGVIDAASYPELLGQAITRLLRGSGRHRQSVAESSFYAWTKFYRQDENAQNAIVSYYTKGMLVALGLDVRLRQVSQDSLCLDDLMRVLWQRHGKTGVGLAETDVERLAGEMAGADLSDFFDLYVRGTAELPLADWLAYLGLGLQLRPARDSQDKGGAAAPCADKPAEGRRALGGRVENHAQGARITYTADGGPAQAAGLAPGDVIIAVDDFQVHADSLDARIANCPEGTAVRVHAFRRGELREFELRPRPAPEDTADLYLLPAGELQADVAQRRQAWLGAGGSGAERPHG
ncbi:MAG: PDZ domain-containing protein [Pseudomonadota bacterium]